MRHIIISQTSLNKLSPNVYNAELTQQLGQAANQTAAAHVFDDYVSRKSANTIKAQRSDLDTFCTFLHSVGQTAIDCDDLQADPAAWTGITWGLVESFVKWQLQQSYSTSSVNRRLSTVKTYAKLASKVGVIAPEDLALIKTVTGYGASEAQNVNEQRTQAGIGTSKERKKSESVPITDAQAKQLKSQPGTPQGRRDALLMALLLDHGLRSSELAGMTIANVNLDDEEISFARQKVKGTDKATARHKLTPDARRALSAWFESGDAPTDGPLLRGSRKGGNLTHKGMSTVSISDRVRTLGEAIGINGLSAHDCRHYAASDMARRGYGVGQLCDWFGWNSPSMAIRYIDAAEVAERDKG